jgi:hypothetical protein
VTPGGSGYGAGTVFEIAKTDTGYASTPTTLVNFCALANCIDGETPLAGLIADANGNLFGSTINTVYEIADSGFVVGRQRGSRFGCFLLGGSRDFAVRIRKYSQLGQSRARTLFRGIQIPSRQ